MKNSRGIFKKMAERRNQRQAVKQLKQEMSKTTSSSYDMLSKITSVKKDVESIPFFKEVSSKKEKPQPVQKPSEASGMEKYRQAVKTTRLADREVKVTPFNGMDEGYAKIARSEMAASKADFESRKAASTPKPKPTAMSKPKMSRTELGDGGEGRPVNLDKRIAATPKATGAVENRSADIMDAIMTVTGVGAVAGLAGAAMRYVGKGATQKAKKEFGKATGRFISRPYTKPPKTAVSNTGTSLFKETGTTQAGKGFWKDFGTSAPKNASKTNPFGKPSSTTYRKSLAGSDVPSAGSKLFTSKVGQNTVKQTTSATTQGRGRSLAGSDIVPMASKKVKK